MNETKREHLASEDQFPWLVAIGAAGMLVALQRPGEASAETEAARTIAHAART